MPHKVPDQAKLFVPQSGPLHTVMSLSSYQYCDLINKFPKTPNFLDKVIGIALVIVIVSGIVLRIHWCLWKCLNPSLCKPHHFRQIFLTTKMED